MNHIRQNLLWVNVRSGIFCLEGKKTCPRTGAVKEVKDAILSAAHPTSWRRWSKMRFGIIWTELQLISELLQQFLPCLIRLLGLSNRKPGLLVVHPPRFRFCSFNEPFLSKRIHAGK
jgi:hypothetical protein